MKKWIRTLSVVLTVAVVTLGFVTPAVAGRAGVREHRRPAETEVLYLDAEIKLINGQPIIVAETENGSVKRIPIQLSQMIWLDGKLQPLVAQGGRVIVPTEDGPVSIPLEEFAVVVASGQVMLVAEENPIVILAAAIVGGAAGIGAGAAAVAGLKSVGIVLGKTAGQIVVATVGLAGAILGGAQALPANQPPAPPTNP